MFYDIDTCSPKSGIFLTSILYSTHCVPLSTRYGSVANESSMLIVLCDDGEIKATLP